jgi:hypothetical protein
MYKAMASVHAAILFAIVASPATYSLTQSLLGGLFKVTSNGTPTVAGLLLHALVYGLLAYAVMWIHRPAGCACGGCQWRDRWSRKYDLEDEDMEDEDDEDEDDEDEDDEDEDMEYDMEYDMEDDMYEDDDM